ncbi:hypothetical protein [Pseudogulbenkiania ferrooxidans]|uniref:Transmembrane protein n=1 Tax=Pseudogulbenkiania ferrooxidans 2002 TaxID=279714 RepID=B9Z6G2_9NEIS|nr:hypothetical protein [Pseudogulbenkiania ferrooxidans]EEG07537.1 hypothetical protein FuraDRAFT_2859 [Pseudogulbenkiania ferrooxidans 2002]
MKRALLVALSLLPLAAFAKDGAGDRWTQPDHGYYQSYPSYRPYQVRIERGVQDGSLTRWEARRLQRQLDDLRAKRRDYLADGYLSRPEQRDLERSEQALSEAIRYQRHDDQNRYWQR